ASLVFFSPQIPQIATQIHTDYTLDDKAIKTVLCAQPLIRASVRTKTDAQITPLMTMAIKSLLCAQPLICASVGTPRMSLTRQSPYMPVNPFIRQTFTC